MAAWRDGATVTVEIAFTNSPLTAVASCTWVDVTSSVRNWNIRRGRTSELSNYSPGTASIELDNRSRLFDPSNTAGAYYGNLVPMKKVRITAASGATSSSVFVGYILGWPIEYPGMVDSTVTIQAVDASKVLAQTAPPANAYEAVAQADSPYAYWALDKIDTGGNSPALIGGVDARNLNQGDPNYSAPADFTITRPVGPTTTKANAGWAATGDSASSLATNSPKTIEGWFWNYNYGVSGGSDIARVAKDSTNWIRLAVSSTDGTVSVGYSNSTDNRSYAYAAIGWQVSSALVHLVLTASTTTLTLYSNGVQVWQGNVVVGTSTNTFATLPPPSMQAVAQGRTGAPTTPAIYGLAVYNANLTSTQVTTHYVAGLTGWGHPLGDRAGTRIGRILDAIGWAAGDRDIATGSTVLGTYNSNSSALAACQTPTDAEQGLLFIGKDGKVVFRDRQWLFTNSSARTSTATFGDNAGETPYSDIEIDGNHVDWLRNTVTVSFTNNSVTVADSTSVAAYGVQDDSVSAGDLPATGTWLARQLAAYRLRLRKDPKTRIPSIKVLPRVATSTHLPTLLNLEIGNRVTVTRRPTGGTGSFSQACFVQGISHQVTPDNWITQLYLAPTTPSYTEGPYLTLGDATYGKIGAVAGNKIPY